MGKTGFWHPQPNSALGKLVFSSFSNIQLKRIKPLITNQGRLAPSILKDNLYSGGHNKYLQFQVLIILRSRWLLHYEVMNNIMVTCCDFLRVVLSRELGTIFLGHKIKHFMGDIDKI